MKIAVTALSLAIATRSALPQKEALFHKTGLDDVYFSNDIIFENGCVRSKLDCARQCASDECCVTFTYTKLYAGHGICRGHWTAVATGNVTTSLYRARTYVYQLHTTDQTVGAGKSGPLRNTYTHTHTHTHTHTIHMPERAHTRVRTCTRQTER